MMARFIKSLMIFTPCAMLFYILAIIIAGGLIPGFSNNILKYKFGTSGFSYTRFREAAHTGNVDILVLGPSNALRGFDPRIFQNEGFRLFNLGSGSQTPVQSEILLKKYINDLNPETIIYVINPESFASDGVESALDLIANEKMDRDIVSMLFKMNNSKTYNSFIFALYRNIFKSHTDFKEISENGEDEYVMGGFVEKKMRYYGNFKHIPIHLDYREKQFDAFNRIVVLCKERKVPLIMLYAPITKGVFRSISNFGEFRERIIKYGEFNNYNPALFLDDSLHFYDSDHLNQAGVTIFNEKVIEQFFKGGKVPK